MVYEVYNGLVEDEFEERLTKVLGELGGCVRWDSEPDVEEILLITNNGSGFHSAYFEIDQVGPITTPIDDWFHGLHLTVFTHGTASWYYVLKEGGNVIDKFDVHG